MSKLKKSKRIAFLIATATASVMLFSGFSSESQQISVRTHPELAIFEKSDLDQSIHETSLVTYDSTSERLTAIQALATGSAACRDAIMQIIDNVDQKISPSPTLIQLLQKLPKTIRQSSQFFSDLVFEVFTTTDISEDLEVFTNNERCGLVIDRAFPEFSADISAYFNKLN